MPHFHLLISYFKAKILKDFAGKDLFSHHSKKNKEILTQFIKIGFKKMSTKEKNNRQNSTSEQ